MKISIRLLQESELSTADQIFRLAFGTFIGLPQPLDFGGDANYIQPRFYADKNATFAAEVDGQLVGSNLAINWGSVGGFGPLSVHPDFWNRGIAQLLIEAAIAKFAEWGTEQAGLFTFSNSPKHHALYQKFGFYPRFLTFIMAKPIQPQHREKTAIVKYSQLSEKERSHCLKECSQIADAIYPGLDLSREIVAVEAQNLGDTVLLRNETSLLGFAVCHCGAGSEAGSDRCYVKFGAVAPGLQARERFEQLLDLCEAFGAEIGMSRLLAGVNTGRDAAYTRMLDIGFRTEITGLLMHKPNKAAYNRSDVFVLDDWR